MKIKKIIALGLAAMTLFAAGCAKTPADTSSAAESENSNVSETEVSTDPAEGFVEPVKNETRDNINAFYSDEKPDRTKRENNILSKHRAHMNRTPDASYPASGVSSLTDGIIPDGFNRNDWLGFYGAMPMKIDFELGDDADKPIGAFRVFCLNQVSYGVGLPIRVSVDISNDGENYTRVANMLAPTQLSESGTYVYNFPLAGTVKAKHIRFDISTCSLGLYFIGEVQAIYYDGEIEKPKEPEKEETTDKWYGDYVVPEIKNPEYFDPSEKDFDKVINLASGKKYQIRALDPLPVAYATTFYNTKEDDGRLTDGKFAKDPTYSDEGLFRFTAGLGREIVIDLGKECAISGFKASFLYERATGVKLPGMVVINASQNGKNWQTVYNKGEFGTEKDADIVSVKSDFEKVYKARYVKISFAVFTHVYCDEIEIYGTKKITDNALDIDKNATVIDPVSNKYITPDDFMGVNNMVLSYHCYPADEPSGKITVEQYLPHVGYYNKDNKVVDTFFDSYLYLPYVAFNYSDKAKSFSGWKYYIDSQFEENVNVDALNKAAHQVGDELNRDVRCSVFFSILYTWTDLTNFGDVDGDGVSENFSKLEDRKKAVKWIIDEQIKRFKEGNYDKLDLLGFYWFEEGINYDDKQIVSLIRYASDYIHSLGYKLIWIPYYAASGYADWKELGFDLACMQPNYAFEGAGGEQRVYDNAAITKKLGMCVEMEIGDWSSKTGIERYRAYMRIGAETGYMNAVKIYYTGGFPGAIYDSYASKDLYRRIVYDETYLFAKGRYEPIDYSGEIFNPDDITLVTTSGRGAKQIVKIDNGSAFTIRVDTAPKYGTIRISSNGEVLYNPFEGFAGKDNFKIYFDYNIGNSRVVNVDVFVKEK